MANKSSANASKTGRFVLVNKMGQVVRSFQVEAPNFAMIYREDTGRIESHSSPKELDEQGIEYSVLAEISRAQLMKEAVKIGDAGTIKWVDDVYIVSPRHTLKEEKDEFKPVLVKAAGINAALVVFCLLINYFFPAVPKVDEPVLVTIEIPKPTEPEKPKPKTKVAKQTVKPTVRPAEKQIKPKVVKVAEKKVVPTKPKIARNLRATSHGHNSSSKRVATGGQNINQVGALSVLGSVSNAPVTGGSLNLKNVTAKLGSGGGGTGAAGHGGLGGAGKGGFANALAGQGLAAASRGSGAVGLPSGGYGTRGRAGGQNGYGRVDLRGSGDGYFQPLEQDAEVGGGLTMEQIKEVINKNMGQILFCYEQGLQQQPTLSGRVGMRFIINGSGQVATASVKNSSLRSSQVEGCILSKLRAFRFPRPVGGVNVNVAYPFNLKRQNVSQR